MLDFEEEVIDHALAERFAMFGFKTKKDEIAVPSVHFVEASAGHDVGIGQIEEALCGQLFGMDVADFIDAAGQGLHL